MDLNFSEPAGESGYRFLNSSRFPFYWVGQNADSSQFRKVHL